MVVLICNKILGIVIAGYVIVNPIPVLAILIGKSVFNARLNISIRKITFYLSMAYSQGQEYRIGSIN